MNYYTRHIGDYITKTIGLTLVQHGAYNRLLDIYYSTEQPISLDIAAVCLEIPTRNTDEEKAVDQVLNSKFFEKRSDGYHQKRCDKEIALWKRNRKNGEKGGRPKKDKNPEETQTEPTPTNPDETLPFPVPRSPFPVPHNSKSNTEKNTAPDKPARHARVSISRPESVEQEVWESFMAQCKAKQKPATAGVMKKIEAEATAAAISLNDALRWSADKGYARFEAEWYLKENPRKAQEKEEVEDQEEKARVEEAEKKRWLKKRGLA